MTMPDGRVVIQIDGDDSLLAADIRNIGRTVESQLGNMQGSFSKAGNALTLAVTAPALAAGGAAFKMAASFETTMNMIAQATGAPVDEMAKLGDLAEQLGADTIYSAGEAADAMLELAKSGLTPAQIAAGALDSALQLAAAGDLALADAAMVTANAINTFNLEAGDSAAVANALAGGANASSASVDSLQQALAQVGPGATNAGLSLQETVAVLAAFADNGIQGSDAGTSLKTMLQRLVPQTDEAAEAMEALGLNFTNADGTFKSIDQIAQQLQDSLGGLTEAERAQTLQTLFGSDATRAATVLMKEGAEGLAQYTAATNDQTAASGMAEARMKGAEGAIEQMSGSVETAALAVGEALAPVVVDLAGKVEELADWFSELDTEQQQQIIQWVAIAAAAGPALKVLSGGIGVIRTLSAVAGSKAVGELAAGIKLVGANAGTSVGQLTSLGAGATAATAGYVALAAAIGFAVGEMINGIPAVQEWQQAIVDATFAGEDVNGWEQPITWGFQQIAKLGAEAGGETAEFTDEAVRRFRILGIELDENNQLTDRGMAQLRAYNASMRASGDSAATAADKYAQYADAIRGVTDAQLGAEGADISLERAKMRLEDAQAEYNKTLSDYPADSREARTAALNLRDAELQVEEAAKRAKVAHESLAEEQSKIPRPASAAEWVAYYKAIGDAAGAAAAKANAANAELADGRAGRTNQILTYGTGGHVTYPHLAIVGDEEEWIINPKSPNAPGLFAELAAHMPLVGRLIGGIQAPVSGGNFTASGGGMSVGGTVVTISPGAVIVHGAPGMSEERVGDIVVEKLSDVVRGALMEG